MNIPKISSIGMTFRPNNIKKLPILATPLLAYYIGESQENNANDILEFFRRKNIKIPDYLKPHADTHHGFNASSKTKIKKALDKALEKKQITKQEHDKYTKKLTFTGAPKDELIQEQGTENAAKAEFDSDNITDNYKEITNPELKTYLQQFDEMDTDLPPDLQEIYNAPPIETPEGIIGSILGDDFLGNNNINLNWDFLSELKQMAAEIADFGG